MRERLALEVIRELIQEFFEGVRRGDQEAVSGACAAT
jgi:hypothetical protein